MTTPCTELRARQEVGVSSTSGMAEPPSPRARKPIPGEAEAVVRDTLRPQEEQQGGRHPLLQFQSRECGLVSLINPPRASHELER